MTCPPVPLASRRERVQTDPHQSGQHDNHRRADAEDRPGSNGGERNPQGEAIGIFALPIRYVVASKTPTMAAVRPVSAGRMVGTAVTET